MEGGDKRNCSQLTFQEASGVRNVCCIQFGLRFPSAWFLFVLFFYEIKAGHLFLIFNVCGCIFVPENPSP